MLLKKITSGFVTQTFDTETNKWVSQEFTAGDECDYENEQGDSIEPFDQDLVVPQPERAPYLPYDMHQPNEKLVIEVSGGNVQSVYVENVSPHVILVDWDNINDGDGAVYYPGNSLQEMSQETTDQVDQLIKFVEEINKDAN